MAAFAFAPEGVTAQSTSPDTAEASVVLDALEQAIQARGLAKGGGGLVHHSDRGSRHLSIRYAERLGEAGIASSAGSVGDSHDNALAETAIGLFKTEIIRGCGPWRSLAAVESATLEWVDWVNHSPLLEPIADVPSAEAEANDNAELETRAAAAQDLKRPASGKPSAVQRFGRPRSCATVAPVVMRYRQVSRGPAARRAGGTLIARRPARASAP